MDLFLGAGLLLPTGVADAAVNADTGWPLPVLMTGGSAVCGAVGT